MEVIWQVETGDFTETVLRLIMNDVYVSPFRLVHRPALKHNQPCCPNLISVCDLKNDYSLLCWAQVVHGFLVVRRQGGSVRSAEFKQLELATNRGTDIFARRAVGATSKA